jgi:hypothetical protein
MRMRSNMPALKRGLRTPQIINSLGIGTGQGYSASGLCKMGKQKDRPEAVSVCRADN